MKIMDHGQEKSNFLLLTKKLFHFIKLIYRQQQQKYDHKTRDVLTHETVYV